ncbi:short chain dehydrogenase/reductase family protein [Talaromyces stipitatus ATCC 10500]|uniref:Short chain dehydrogenase/reductase family protein n=1 Tax=Talaromyces stipitatus (strain ATCC 10500 / CBS 375.48 / QM 6759 / NRRL 1006) TaxID=441959 RepID=B8M1D3_TALSN|nr:short chain dehydrogenase/reductase family protein [Talaromyces stipitatus ATCC 10500]EED21829.1 short chain dehydrogenase/reductase family protein [Talaromyces stipitatus ATCC 10500]
MPNRILPREGFTADVIGSILRQTVFDPVKTFLTILLFQYAPPNARYLPRHRETVLKWLRIAFALGVIRRVNTFLGRRAINRGISDEYDWPREIIVVTGGSNGFGKEQVLMLAKRARSKIAILDVMPPDYVLPGGVRFFKCDITSSDAIAAAATDIRREFGGDPTILINNAGIIYARPILENTDREIQKMFEVNTLSQYKLLHQFLPAIVRRNHGMIVTVASQGGNCTTPGMTAYCASKAASINLHEGLASELVTRYNAPRVRTVLVTPAFAKTFVTRDLIPEDSFLSPLLEPETVAEAVVDQVLKAESGYVGVSATANWFTFNLRSMPLWYQTGLRDRLDRTVQAPGKRHSWVKRDE